MHVDDFEVVSAAEEAFCHKAVPATPPPKGVRASPSMADETSVEQPAKPRGQGGPDGPEAMEEELEEGEPPPTHNGEKNEVDADEVTATYVAA